MKKAVIYTYSPDRKGIDEWCEDNLPVGTWALTCDYGNRKEMIIIIYDKEVLNDVKDPLFTIRIMNEVWKVADKNEIF